KPGMRRIALGAQGLRKPKCQNQRCWYCPKSERQAPGSAHQVFDWNGKSCCRCRTCTKRHCVSASHDGGMFWEIAFYQSRQKHITHCDCRTRQTRTHKEPRKIIKTSYHQPQG